MRAVLYGRVSTANNGQDVTMQIREFHEFCKNRGWNVTDEYVDAGISGSKDSRPELNRLMADAKRRKFDAVIVYRFDRFARSTRHLVNALAEFNALGIQFVSMHEGVDTTTPNGRLVFGIFASIAEFERELIRDRVRSGLRNAKAKGKRLGRPRTNVNAAKIASLRSQGASWSEVCTETGLTAGTAKRAFYSLSKNPSEATPLTA
jgi:DNA invertase Pin-like site-specific DNA recombinase